MSEESRSFAASNRAADFVATSRTIDAHVYAGKIGWPEDQMFADYCSRAVETGITGMGLSVANQNDDFEAALKTRKNLITHLDAWSSEVVVAKTTSDFDAAKKAGSLAVYFSAQGSALLDDDPKSTLPKLKALGLGTLSPVYNLSFPAGDGCMIDDPRPVTDYGKLVIEQVHANKIVLDLSHASEATALSAISHSKNVAPDRPVIYTHSAPLGMCKSNRNISDAEIKACADTGGVIAVNTSPWFLISDRATETRPEDIVRVITYIRDLVGIDHVALGSDDVFSTQTMWELIRKTGKPNFGDSERARQQSELTWQAAHTDAFGTAEAAKIYPALTDAFWEAGYSDADIRKVLGENLLRVFALVWD